MQVPPEAPKTFPPFQRTKTLGGGSDVITPPFGIDAGGAFFEGEPSLDLKPGNFEAREEEMENRLPKYFVHSHPLPRARI